VLLSTTFDALHGLLRLNLSLLWYMGMLRCSVTQYLRMIVNRRRTASVTFVALSAPPVLRIPFLVFGMFADEIIPY